MVPSNSKTPEEANNHSLEDNQVHSEVEVENGTAEGNGNIEERAKNAESGNDSYITKTDNDVGAENDKALTCDLVTRDVCEPENKHEKAKLAHKTISPPSLEKVEEIEILLSDLKFDGEPSGSQILSETLETIKASVEKTIRNDELLLEYQLRKITSIFAEASLRIEKCVYNRQVKLEEEFKSVMGSISEHLDSLKLKEEVISKVFEGLQDTIRMPSFEEPSKSNHGESKTASDEQVECQKE